MGDPKRYFTICILPWIHFDKIYEVNGARLLPYPQHNFPADFRTALEEVLSSYKEIQGESISQCTIVSLSNKQPEWCLDGESDDLDKIQECLSLFFLAAMSCNNYFSQDSTYSNSSAFQPIFQNLTIPPRGHAVRYRRRDGFIEDSGYKHGDLKYSRPLECKSLKPKIDGELLLALDKAANKNDELYRRLLVSLSFFRLANTDQSHMSLDSEVVLLAAAFEILLDAEKARQLVGNFSELFSSYQEVIVESALQKRPGITLDPSYQDAQKQWQLSKKFIQELHQLRSKIVHGEDRTKRTWGWNNFEHLVIGAYIYPLAVKLLLGKTGHHSLFEHDQIAYRSIDIILAETNWSEPPSKNGNQTQWQKCISQARWDLAESNALKRLETLAEEEEDVSS